MPTALTVTAKMVKMENIFCLITKRGAQRTSDLFVFNQGHHAGPLKESERLGHMNDALSVLLTGSLTCAGRITSAGIFTIWAALQVCVKNHVKAKN